MQQSSSEIQRVSSSHENDLCLTSLPQTSTGDLRPRSPSENSSVTNETFDLGHASLNGWPVRNDDDENRSSGETENAAASTCEDSVEREDVSESLVKESDPHLTFPADNDLEYGSELELGVDGGGDDFSAEAEGTTQHEVDLNSERLKIMLSWNGGVDLDLSATMLDDLITVVKDIVWYAKRLSVNGSVSLLNDVQSNDANCKTETMIVDLASVPFNVGHIAFVVGIYLSNGRQLDQVTEGLVTIAAEYSNHEPEILLAAKTSEMTGSAALFGQLTRKGGRWCIRKLQEPFTDQKEQELLLKDPDNFMSLSLCPAVLPDLVRIRVCVLSGKDLVAKDERRFFQRRATSDPYYIIEYHNTMSYASEFVSRTLNPTWKEKYYDMGIVTDCVTHELNISVYDYDFNISARKGDFMGMVKIPAVELYRLGSGQYNLTRKLEALTNGEFRNVHVSGEINFNVEVGIVSCDDAALYSIDG